MVKKKADLPSPYILNSPWYNLNRVPELKQENQCMETHCLK